MDIEDMKYQILPNLGMNAFTILPIGEIKNIWV